MNHFEHPDHTHHSIDAVLQDPELKRQVLRHAVDLVSRDFQTHDLHNAIDRKLYEDAEEVVPTDFTGRTILVAEEALLEYLDSLEAQNRELHKKIAAGGEVNVAESERQLKHNEQRVRMIRGNCLDSFVKATDKILFPGETKSVLMR